MNKGYVAASVVLFALSLASAVLSWDNGVGLGDAVLSPGMADGEKDLLDKADRPTLVTGRKTPLWAAAGAGKAAQ